MIAVRDTQGLGILPFIPLIAAGISAGTGIFSTIKQSEIAKKQIKAQKQAMDQQVQMAREQRAHELELIRTQAAYGPPSPVAVVQSYLPYVAVGLLAWWALKT